MTPNKAPIEPLSDASIEKAAKILAAGGLVAFPTETVYGLGGDATNGEAVARIFAAKGRPSINPLIVHVADLAAARRTAAFNPLADKLAATLWPGPLSLVLPARSDAGISSLTSAGLSTVAVRVPASAAARQLLTACGLPIAAPSANRSGGISPTRAAHVQTSLPGPDDGGPALILDGGPCAVGLESTVVDLSTETPTLLRPGGVASEDIEAVIGRLAIAGNDDLAPKSPGMLSRHYAPATPLRLEARRAEPGEVFLGFGSVEATPGLNLSPKADLIEAAANLFQYLHQLDQRSATAIAVAAIPEHGLGRAINDRLRRGATR
ncbi:MAG: L-threonylcarbamoyladenylate synthase [Proteobacteria bacterium]|nr:L-threonylcarbamoyladenylate synthase [Pseudomonadota bacterium]